MMTDWLRQSPESNGVLEQFILTSELNACCAPPRLILPSAYHDVHVWFHAIGLDKVRLK